MIPEQNQLVEIIIHDFIRKEQKFKNVDLLKNEIQNDIMIAKKLHFSI